jgi:precorrin-3B synthase
MTVVIVNSASSWTRWRELKVNRSTAFEVKGWCPGALRPMPSGDGLIVRVRPQSGALSSDELLVLADAAGRFGNGHIDLTRRANLQIRGVSEASLPPLHDVIARLGLLDGDPDGEAVRNVMINPLAGIDPSEALDVRDIARELTRRLETEPSLWALPTKFGFIVDGGGILGLATQRADIRLAAIKSGSDGAIAVGLDTQSGIDWLGAVSPASAAAVAIEIAHAFLDTTSRGARQRMRDLSAENLASLKSKIRSRLDPLMTDVPAIDAPSRRVGLLSLGLDRFAVGIAAPFGRAETDQLRKLIDVMTATGIKEIRLSPWRVLYAPVPSQQAGQHILDIARHAGFAVDPSDPLLQIEACTGAPACQSTSLDTRGDARRIAELLARFRFTGTVHVSGCAKGCAKSGIADLVLVGSEGDYGIVHQGTAQDRPSRRVEASELASGVGAIIGLVGTTLHD